MDTSQFITRKEIAALVEESVDYVRRHEIRWGIIGHRANFLRPYKYWRAPVLEKLRSANVLK